MTVDPGVRMDSSPQQQVRAYLARPDVAPHVKQLVEAWNDHELLGVQLADALESLIRQVGAPFNYSLVDWNELAEDLALLVCGVDEEELTQRRRDLARDKV